ncbi:translation initiation factor eIF-2B subunit epsilon [Impatiens glandulifera]|uniref:translation initiation factor eIF-2B subunit epsilon n=1 Tax=Impatiens glandulifera TaxID=253017 RepID=UPI001FB0707A|nr:translation initiation factor eIF-2B subunit epsilon [Impatiens glandulifera]
MVQKKGAGKASEDAEEELTRAPLQAILLADSFAQKFRPITLERPKVLLPLANVPMIDYTLAWLESAGVEEVFIFVCAHSKQVIDYVNSTWLGESNFSIKTIESHNCISAGDALRLIYERNVIHGDFILISGDTVSNMSLAEAVEEHKERKKKDSNAVMTMVIKRSKPSPITHQSRLGTDELFMAIDPDSKQLLYYEDKANHLKGILTLDKMLLSDNVSISFHNDKQDCYIDICSPEVLSLFTDNFDYQHLRRHFLKGLLMDDIMGYKIYVHEIHSSYAARIDNFRSYDTISKDIIQRWTYPFVPDVFGSSSTKHDRQGVYRASGVLQSRSAQIGPFALVGSDTTIGDKTKIYNSVVGEGCNIGSDVSIDGCYIWDNVTIENGCKLSHAIVCDGVTMKSGAVLEPGVVLSFNVVVGQGFVVPAYSKVSLHQQPTKQDSDEELEYAEDSSGFVKIPAINGTTDHLTPGLLSELSEAQGQATSEVGNGGVGYIWSIDVNSYDEEIWQSVAPIPAEKLAEIVQKATTDELEMTQDGNLLPPSGELPLDSNSVGSGDDDVDDTRDDYFEKEVEATFQRAAHENVKEDHVILEVNSLRLSCNKTSADCAGALFYSMVKLAVDTPHSSTSELHKIVINVLTTWQKVLKNYLLSQDEQIEVILKFEEICLETAKELSSIFTQVLHFLYDKDILQEDAILNWADEKEGADESDKVLVKQADKFIQWLKEASEEEDDEEDD